MASEPTAEEIAARGDLYAEAAAALLPPGRIWSKREGALIQSAQRAAGAEFAKVQYRAERLLIELYPPTTDELLPEWETLLGLPDACTPAAQTIEERRTRVLLRLLAEPKPTIPYFEEIAQRLGYAGVTFAENSALYRLTVGVPNAKVTYFRTGVSHCGDLLGVIGRASDLECLLREEKPAHVELVFNYSGV